MKKLGIFIVLINLLLIDGYMVYDIYRGFSETVSNDQVPSAPSFVDKIGLPTDNCGEDCQAYIDAKVSQLSQSEAGSAPTSGESATAVTVLPTKTKVKSTSYVPIPGSGSTLATGWTTITGTDFYMSKGDYQGFTGAYFEANMKLINGNGIAYLRLFDVTNGRAVDGSEIQTSSQTSVFVTSAAVTLWDGYNHYQVQAKSLTADTTVFESGRLKILTQN